MADIESGLLGAMELLLEIKTEVKEIKDIKDETSLKDNIKVLVSYTNECKKEIISLIILTTQMNIKIFFSHR